MTRRFLSCQAGEFFLASAPSGTGVRAGSRFPATFFPLFQTCARKGQPTGRKKGVQYMNQLIQSKSFTTFIVLAMTLTCLGLLPNAQAVVPPPDGGYAGSNTAEGTDALLSLSSGIWNTALGFQALNHDTAGNQNTATGVRALTSDTNGGFNTATGVLSLFSNTSGFFNSATGAYSLANNISGSNNTANGYAALYRNTANGSTATGFAALYHNTTGTENTANGANTLFNNTPASSTRPSVLMRSLAILIWWCATGGQSQHRALRSGKRDAAKRVPERAPQSGGISIDGCKAASDNRAAAKGLPSKDWQT